MLGYPHMGGRCYMMNEQLSWLTPCSQQVAPGLTWRSEAHEEIHDREELNSFVVFVVFVAFVAVVVIAFACIRR